MIDNGQSLPYVAQALGSSEAFIYKWKQRNEREEKLYPANQTSEALIENQRLLQGVSEIGTERDILKKAEQ